MATLVGNTDTTGMTSDLLVSGDTVYAPLFSGGYTAIATGTADTFHVWCGDLFSGVAWKGLVYDSGKNLIATTSTTLGSGSPGWRTMTVSASITNGNTYWLAIISDGGGASRLRYDGTTTQALADISGSYASPPDPASGSSGIGEWPVYLSGTALAITSVSTDDTIGAAENPWNITGSGFGDD